MDAEYKEVQPAKDLRHFIKCYWKCNFKADAEYSILPDSYFDMIFQIDDNTLYNSRLTGLWIKDKMCKATKGTQMVACRFKLLSVEYILNSEIKSLLNTSRQINANDLGLDITTLNDFDAFCSHLNRLFGQKVAEQEIDRRKLNLFEAAYNHQGDITVEALSDEIHWSSRQINRYFGSRFGISLKQFLNILRCRASYGKIAEGDVSPLTSYFDQAHYIKEINRYTVATPSQL